jgi:predicted Rossmann-fold nucleotide-binding protein
VSFLDHATQEGFLKPGHRALLLVDSDPAALLDALHAAANAESDSPA